MPRRPTRSDLTLTDMFCGAGGASIGAVTSGLQLVMAINHEPLSILTHQTNFPNADHDCHDVSAGHPSRYRTTDILWASPECPKWSQARGKKRDQGITGQLGIDDKSSRRPTPAEVRSRVTMWDVVRFTEYHLYSAVIVENVVDVMPWSLLPVWYRAMETLGYDHRTLFINSMNHGAPQSRDRWYVVFWRRGNRKPDLEFTPPAWCPKCETEVEGRQSFKKPSRWTDRYGAQYLFRCPRCASVTWPRVPPALSALDLSVRGQRIGDRDEPLADATMARVQAGVDRHWGRPGIIDLLRDPKIRDALTQPLPTQTGRQSLAVYLPVITRLRGTSTSHITGSSRSSADPLGTISAGGNHHGMICPPLYVKMNGSADKAGPMAHPVTDPLGSLTSKGHVALVVPVNGNRHGDGGERVRSIAEPLTTQTADLYRALVTSYYGDDPARPVDQPLGAVTSHLHHAFVSTYYRTPVNRGVGEPMPTMCGTDSHALIEGPAIRVEDCYFRMLMPKEIGAGMAFPRSYIVLGNKRQQVRGYGLAVTPPVPTAICDRVVDSLR